MVDVGGMSENITSMIRKKHPSPKNSDILSICVRQQTDLFLMIGEGGENVYEEQLKNRWQKHYHQK